MFSALCRYFYGVRGPLGRSEILFFAKKSSKKPGYSKRSILGKKAQNRDIGPTHMFISVAYMDYWLWWGGYDVLRYLQPKYCSQKPKKEETPLAFIEWCFLGLFWGTFGPLYPKRQHFWLTRVNQNMFFTYPMIRATFYLFTVF